MSKKITSLRPTKIFLVDDEVQCIIRLQRVIGDLAWLGGELKSLELTTDRAGQLAESIKRLPMPVRHLSKSPKILRQLITPLWIAPADAVHPTLTPTTPAEACRALKESENSLAFIDASFADAGDAVIDWFRGKYPDLGLPDDPFRVNTVGGEVLVYEFASHMPATKRFVATSVSPGPLLRTHELAVKGDSWGARSDFHAAKSVMNALNGWWTMINGGPNIGPPFRLSITKGDPAGITISGVGGSHDVPNISARWFLENLAYERRADRRLTVADGEGLFQTAHNRGWTNCSDSQTWYDGIKRSLATKVAVEALIDRDKTKTTRRGVDQQGSWQLNAEVTFRRGRKPGSGRLEPTTSVEPVSRTQQTTKREATRIAGIRPITLEPSVHCRVGSLQTSQQMVSDPDVRELVQKAIDNIVDSNIRIVALELYSSLLNDASDDTVKAVPKLAEELGVDQAQVLRWEKNAESIVEASVRRLLRSAE